jgi:hypothetical protein
MIVLHTYVYEQSNIIPHYITECHFFHSTNRIDLSPSLVMCEAIDSYLRIA